ncbi:MAG: transglycosylase SLT domain-containing protein [Defluviicoccus sp.]|nr:MAG: transglycosylase SLT domain-containing protein [Defluviicoccus sp.]
MEEHGACPRRDDHGRECWHGRSGLPARTQAGPVRHRVSPAAYPIPHWRPEGGYNTDRALIFALMRQESKFRADAVSQAGARG